MESKVCSFCGSGSADLLCDAPVGFALAGFDGGHFNLRWRFWEGQFFCLSSDSEMFTCDLPFCESCRTFAEPIFMCGEESCVVVGDLCPLHRTAPSLGGERPLAVLTVGEVEGWRDRALLMVGAHQIEQIPAYPVTGFAIKQGATPKRGPAPTVPKRTA